MKKTLLVLSLIATIAITFFACSEREHTNPLDSEYWSKSIDPVATLTKSVVDLEHISLNWTIGQNTYPDGYKFRLDRKTGTSEWEERYKILPQDILNYTDTLDIGTVYQYQLYISYDENISSSKDITHDNTFPAPIDFNATQTSITSADLSWKDNSIGEEKFEIERKLSTETTYAKIAEVTGSDTASKAYSDTTLEPGKIYDYQVKAVKGTNSSAYAIQLNFNNVFSAPTDFNVTQTSITGANLTWTDNSIGEDKFEIERKLSTETTYAKIAEVTGSDTTSKNWSDTALILDLTYNYQVRAVYGTNSSNYTQETLVNTIPAPSNLTATVASDTSIKLDWTDNSANEQGFKIDRKVGAAGTWVTDYATVGSNVKTYTNTGLTPGTTYYYRVRAYYSTYYSSYTSEVTPQEIVPTGFISIPTGSFSMGQTDVATPVHTVNITRPFYLGKYEVTQKEWQTTMGSNPASGYGVGDNYPVYYVSWYSILVYCNKRSMAEGLTRCYTINGSTDPATWGAVPTSSNATWNAVTCDFSAKGYRLPTEAEWEYAARYNDGRTYPWGETAPSSTLCNYNSNVGATTAVGSYPSGNSNLGLCDMAGNVWEWVWDWYATYPGTTQTDPSGPTTAQTSRVLRGGSWDSLVYIRCANRGYYYPSNAYYLSGFRLSRTK